MATICPVIDQHAEEAAFLWLSRDGAVRAPHYRLWELAKLDNRVDAHLDGLRIAGNPGWDIAKAQLEAGEGGETFVATVLSGESGDEERIQAVLELGSASEDRVRGLISGLGWVHSNEALQLARVAMNKKAPVFRRIVVAVAAIHRVNPGEELLQTLLDDPDLTVQARTAKAIGELGIVNLVSSLSAKLTVEDPACRFAAAWSIGLLNGAPGALTQLRRVVEEGSLFAPKALQLVLRRMPLADANRWLASLVQQDKAVLRSAVVGTGVTGDPKWVPFLLEQMSNKQVTQVAGEAFSMLTGVDLAYQDLDLSPPEESGAGPTEDPEDPNVAMDPDENLPWPDPARIQAWWNKNGSAFSPGTKYLVGKPITLEWLAEVLKSGRQRQRAAAALELAILQPGKPLFNVCAPGFRQQHWLSGK